MQLSSGKSRLRSSSLKKSGKRGPTRMNLKVRTVDALLYESGIELGLRGKSVTSGFAAPNSVVPSHAESKTAKTAPGAEPSPETVLVGYCTDVEGNYDYWQRYLNISRVISRVAPPEVEVLAVEQKGMISDLNVTSATPDGAASVTSLTLGAGMGVNGGYDGYEAYTRLTLADGCHFVFGGDVCDRGPGDLRVLRDIIQLQEDYPDRVHIILGNRDVNKLRIPTELHEKFLRDPGQTYWLPSDLEQVSNQAPTKRLKWMLQKTMGAPNGWEYRKKELILLKKLQMSSDSVSQLLSVQKGEEGSLAGSTIMSINEGGSVLSIEKYSAYSDIAAKWGTTADELVSDAEVFQSFFDNLMPPPNGNFNDNNDNNDNIIYTNNENAIPTDDRLFGSLQSQALLTKYLLHGKAMHRMGDTLFVHGGLNEYNAGWVPPPSPFERRPIEGTAALEALALSKGDRDSKDGDKNNEDTNTNTNNNNTANEDEFVVALGGERRKIKNKEQFDSWISEINTAVKDETRDFCANTPGFLRSLNHPNSRDGDQAEYRNGTVHWGKVGTYGHPQPGSRLAAMGMARIPVPDQPNERVRNPSVVYNSYTYNGMPVNIDKYKPDADSHNETAAALAALAAMHMHMSSSFQPNSSHSKPSSPGPKLSASRGPVSADIHAKSGLSADDRLSMTPKMAQKVVSDFGISRILVGHQPHGDAPTTINYSFPPPPSPSPSSSSDTTAGDTHVSAFASGKNKCVGSTSTDTATDGGRKGGSDSDSNSEGEGGDHFSPPPQRDPFLQITMGDTSYSRNTLWNFNPTYIKKQGKEISLSYDENWQPISLERLVKENATTGGDYVRDSKVDAGRRRTGVAMTLNADNVGDQDTRSAGSAGSYNSYSNSNSQEFNAQTLSTAAETIQNQRDAIKKGSKGKQVNPLHLFNIAAIQDDNTRSLSVSEILVYVPQYVNTSTSTNLSGSKSPTSKATSTSTSTSKPDFKDSSAKGEGAKEYLGEGMVFKEPKGRSRSFVHGVLSDGSTYAFEQPSPGLGKHAHAASAGVEAKGGSGIGSSSRSRSTREYNGYNEEEEEEINRDTGSLDPYVGKANMSGTWFVKAVNVQPKHGTTLTDGRGNSIVQMPKGKIYLLSCGEGFRFKNRFVGEDEMEEEMLQ